MTTKTNKAYLVRSNLAYHDKFIVIADSVGEAGIKAEKIVKEQNGDCVVQSIQETLDVLDWVERVEENG